jgi:16S rRNA U1498 N3-methylase RsmE
MEPAERELLLEAGFQPVKIAPLTLRFETAAIAGLTLARAMLSCAQEEARTGL